jgi:aspartyl-tRNA(Asn)/glutamyl-tRNA(Gln) amidotransferase subunit C
VRSKAFGAMGVITLTRPGYRPSTLSHRGRGKELSSGERPPPHPSLPVSPFPRFADSPFPSLPRVPASPPLRVVFISPALRIAPEPILLYTEALKGGCVLNRELFERLQTLSKLRLPKEEAEFLLPQLERIVGFVRQLESLDSEVAAPPARFPRPALRDDTPLDGLAHEMAVHAAPSVSDGLFKVPPVLPAESP